MILGVPNCKHSGNQSHKSSLQGRLSSTAGPVPRDVGKWTTWRFYEGTPGLPKSVGDSA